jgi:1,4-alpha-glucan branching enzyme
MSVSKKYNKTTNEVKLTFKVTKEASQNAKQVFLLCENNGWDPVEMTQLKSGDFKVDVKVEGKLDAEYQYRFRLVMEDGQEIFDNDWEADRYVPNVFGGENSLVDLKIGLTADIEEAAPAAAPKAEKTAAPKAADEKPAKKTTAAKKTTSAAKKKK